MLSGEDMWAHCEGYSPILEHSGTVPGLGLEDTTIILGRILLPSQSGQQNFQDQGLQAVLFQQPLRSSDAEDRKKKKRGK